MRSLLILSFGIILSTIKCEAQVLADTVQLVKLQVSETLMFRLYSLTFYQPRKHQYIDVNFYTKDNDSSLTESKIKLVEKEFYNINTELISWCSIKQSANFYSTYFQPVDSLACNKVVFVNLKPICSKRIYRKMMQVSDVILGSDSCLYRVISIDHVIMPMDFDSNDIRKH